MIRITKESIEEHLLSKGWKVKTIISSHVYYTSPDERFNLFVTIFSNMVPEEEDGWDLQIDDSKMRSLARCNVEYIEQIFALIDIYKDY